MICVRQSRRKRILAATTFLMLPLVSAQYAAQAVAAEDRYLWLVTIDGLRPEEVFTGAEKKLIDKEIGGVDDPDALLAQFWRSDPSVRRELLMPFFWQVVAKQGQVFGDTDVGSVVRVTNGRYFSYPGYQEILCGFPDDAVDSNDKVNNANVTVLEWLSKRPGLENRIAAFASWDVFPFIINSQRSGLYVNAGWQELDVVADADRKDILNQAIRETPHYWAGARFDFHTFTGAMEYVKERQPHVLYLALDEPDDWGHAGRYDLYLQAAHRCDHYLRTLWDYAQSSERYRGKTSMLITTDHGRGNGREGWKNHGADLPGSERIWSAVLGPDTPALGIREDVKATQAQTAASAAALMGEDFAASDPRIAVQLPDIVAVEGEPVATDSKSLSAAKSN